MSSLRSPAERLETAQIREWARENGWPDIKAQGKIPAAVRDAWEAARQQAGQRGYEDIDGGGDLSGMDESGLDEIDLPDWVNAPFMPGLGPAVPQLTEPAGQPPPDDGELPPPASLDEARERVGRDPGAAHLIRRGKTGSRAREPKVSEPVKVTKAVRDDITGKLAFWLSIPAEPWLRVDPYCGQAYADQVDQIALKMSPLICLSPDMVRWFSKSSTFILWTELGMACRPVAEAWIAHHITKRIALTEEGEPVIQQDGGMDFSAYSRRVSTAALLRADRRSPETRDRSGTAEPHADRRAVFRCRGGAGPDAPCCRILH
jgi:hypothetical protein